MPPLLFRQPFRFLYLCYFAVTTVTVKVPYWTLISFLRSTRPKASWSIEKCVRIYLLRSIFMLPMKLGLEMKRDLSKAVLDTSLRNAKFVWIDGIKDNALVGEVQKFAAKTGVKPMKIPGYWQLKKGTMGDWTPGAKAGEKVLYHLHGGGFWIGTAHPSDMTANIPRGILEHSQTITRTFAVDYRKSASAPFKAENPFPAGLLDCLAGYQYLIGLGFLAKNIVVAGDSAGGNLAMALVRHLTENLTGLEKPGKLLLLSPWGDLSSSRLGPTSSLTRNRKTDMLPVPEEAPAKRSPGMHGVKSYLGTGLGWEDTKTNKYLSPASPHLEDAEKMFQKYPRTYILAGGAEMLLDDAEVLAERIKGAGNGQDNWVTLDVVADAVHDFCVLPWYKPERGEALSRISRWIDED